MIMAKTDQLPSDSVLQTYVGAKDFMDSYGVDIGQRQDLQQCDMRELAEQFGNIELGWAIWLLKLRNILMSPLKLKTTDDLAAEQVTKPSTEKRVGDRVAFFRIFEILDDEIILGEDDWHQDFRVSLYRTKGKNARVIMTTVCKRHNAFGHAYLAAILPFHKMIVCATLDDGAKKRFRPTA